MKSLLIAGNWKSNKDVSEATLWLETFGRLMLGIKNSLRDHKIVLCAPYSDLYPLKKIRDDRHFPIELGAQDVSPFGEGAYTGEVSARMLKELVDWVIIGHSERRSYMHEGDEELVKETSQAVVAGLHVIYCVSNDQMMVPADVAYVAYEPVPAIGTGKAQDPVEAGKVIAAIKQRHNIQKALYGGSVTADNVATFVQESSINGVLIGGASLDPHAFFLLIQKAIQAAA